MSSLPPPPRRGQNIRDYTAQLHRALKSIWPRTSATIKVTITEGGTTYEARPREEFDYKRFLIRYNSVTSADVIQGAWTRTGNRVNMTAPDNDGVDTFKTLTGLSASSEIYYITLTLSQSGALDPAITPDTLTVTAETSILSDDADNLRFVIGTVQTDGSGEITDIVQYKLGDIDDTVTVPDADTVTPPHYSMQRATAGEQMHYEFDSPSVSQAMAEDDRVEVRQSVGVGGNPTLIYIDADDFWDWLFAYGEPGAGWPWEDPAQVGMTHASLTEWQAGDPINDFANYYDDHAIGTQKGRISTSQAAYPLFLIGNHSGTFQERFDRNAILGEDNYCGHSLWIESTAYVNTIANQNAGVGETTRINVSTNTLTGGAWTADDTTAAADGAGAFYTPNGGIASDHGVYANKGNAASGAGEFWNGAIGARLGGGAAGLFTDGTRTVGISDTAVAIQASDGASTVQVLDGTYGVDSTLKINVNTGQGYYVDDTQVVTDQQAAIANIVETGAARDGDVRAKVNVILAMLRVHGLIDT